MTVPDHAVGRHMTLYKCQRSEKGRKSILEIPTPGESVEAGLSLFGLGVTLGGSLVRQVASRCALDFDTAKMIQNSASILKVDVLFQAAMELTAEQKARVVENRRRLLIGLEQLLRRQNAAVEVLQQSMPLQVHAHAATRAHAPHSAPHATCASQTVNCRHSILSTCTCKSGTVHR